MTTSTSLTNSPWYSVNGDEKVKELYNQFLLELNKVKQNTISNLERMEVVSVKNYEKLSNLPYSEKIKLFDFGRLRKIQSKLSFLKKTEFKHMEVSQWCFENYEDENVGNRIKNEALHYFDLYIN